MPPFNTCSSFKERISPDSVVVIFSQVAACNKSKLRDWMKAQKYMKQKVLNPCVCWFSIFRTELRGYGGGGREQLKNKGLSTLEAQGRPESSAQSMFQPRR